VEFLKSRRIVESSKHEKYKVHWARERKNPLCKFLARNSYFIIQNDNFYYSKLPLGSMKTIASQLSLIIHIFAIH
jgi:hypothetical protein